MLRYARADGMARFHRSMTEDERIVPKMGLHVRRETGIRVICNINNYPILGQRVLEK